MGEFLENSPRLTLEVFHAFRDERPKGEKRKMIDGVPMQVPPSSLIHERIGRNPEPETTVIDTAIGIGEVCTERLCFFAKVPSPGNRPDGRAGLDRPLALAAMPACCQRHEHHRGARIVQQDVIATDLHGRSGNGWSRRELRDADDDITIPDFGDIGPLGDFYRYTALFAGPAGGRVERCDQFDETAGWVGGPFNLPPAIQRIEARQPIVGGRRAIAAGARSNHRTTGADPNA